MRKEVERKNVYMYLVTYVNSLKPQPLSSSLLSLQPVIPLQTQLRGTQSPLSHCHWPEEHDGIVGVGGGEAMREKYTGNIKNLKSSRMSILYIREQFFGQAL